MTTKALGLSQALSARLQRVLIANGFATDAGVRVYRGKRRLDPEELPCIVLVEGDDNTEGSAGRGTNAKVSQRYQAEAHAAAADPDNPDDTAHLLLGDLKRAVFGEDVRLLAGHVSTIRYAGRRLGAREDGSGFVFATLQFDIDVAEDLAKP